MNRFRPTPLVLDTPMETQNTLREFRNRFVTRSKHKTTEPSGSGDTPTDIFAPKTLDEFIGQAKAKKLVRVMVQAAKVENRPLPNTMISGPFGQGKSALARLMVELYGAKVPVIDGTSANKSVPDSGIVIIDEIHNLEPEICDTLNVMLDKGIVHIVGCTTNPGALPAAFRSRFRSIYLEPYEIKDVTFILKNAVKRKGVTARTAFLTNVATRSRFNPRMALNYLALVFDIMAVKKSTVATRQIIDEAFTQLGVDKYGFQTRDYAYMHALPGDGRSVGLQYISAMIQIDEKTIEEEIEPFLMQMGLVDRSSRGRRKIADIAAVHDSIASEG
jgi:Holliday junction DNA helicase RuvB